MAGDQQIYDFGFKRITEYSADELDLAVRIAVGECGRANLDFYTVLRGVDAYQEKRRRKQAAAPAGGRHGTRTDEGSQ
jgi:hypothetical protein